MIRVLWQSRALFAIAPMQDLLDLGDEARMNLPGSLGDNWEWIMAKKWNSKHLKEWLLEINQLYSRD
jgi:4-alpha-glucanotransferase